MSYPTGHEPSVNDGVEGLLVQIAEAINDTNDSDAGDATAANQTTQNNHLAQIEAAVEGATPAGTNNIGDVDVLTQRGAGNLATSQVATSGTAGTLAIARATRRSILIRNLDTTITVYVGPATVTAGNGFPLKAGESAPFTWVGLIQVIAASGTPTVAIADEYD